MFHVVGLYHDSQLAAWCYHVTEEGEDLIVIFAARAAVSSRITHGCKYTIQTGTFTEAFMQSKHVNEKHCDFVQVCSRGRSGVRTHLQTLQLQRSLTSCTTDSVAAFPGLLFAAAFPAGLKKTFGAFSTCFQHCAPALLLGCCDLLKPESNQPVAVRMEGLLSECCCLLLVHSSCIFAVAGMLHMYPMCETVH